MNLCPPDRKMFNEIKEAGDNGTFIEECKGLRRLEEKGLIDIHPTVKDEDGKFAVRLHVEESEEKTITGDGSGEALPPIETEPKKEEKPMPTEKPLFEIESSPAIAPKRRRGGKGRSKYPFDEMRAPYKNEDGKMIYANFHVPATEEKPNPEKGLPSTCCNQNKKSQDENGEATKQFVCRRVEDDDPKGAGARIYRIK